MGIGQPYHRQSEGVDLVDVFNTVLPGDETLNIDVQLVPDAHDGLIILVVPERGRQQTSLRAVKATIVTVQFYNSTTLILDIL